MSLIARWWQRPSDGLRHAERRDFNEMLALAEAQAAALHQRDPRLSPQPQLAPFLSDARTLDEILLWHQHALFVLQQAGALSGAISLCKIAQRAEDTFASYYPRVFTSIGLIHTPSAHLSDLLIRAHVQAVRWNAPALLTQHASADLATEAVLRTLGFRDYYHYAMRADATMVPPEISAGDAISVHSATTHDLEALVPLGMQSLAYHASCEPTLQLAQDEASKMRERFAQAVTSGEHNTILVASQHAEIIGFASLYTQTIDDTWSPPLFASGRYGLLAEVAVAESWRGRGVGRRIFAAALDWFRARDIHTHWLIYLARNPLSSRFWPMLGFKPVWTLMFREAMPL